MSSSSVASRKVSTAAGQRLYERARQLIPGGTQLLSKRPEQFLPGRWPSYFERAAGVELVDLDGNRYVDMSLMGIGACVLGYADPDVDGAVKAAVESGVATTLNAPEEVWLAEVLCELHPWAEMVRYTRSGGEAMALAIRIARAHTGRDAVAFCGYHGWTDWYLAANVGDDHALDGQLMPGLDPAGVPRALGGTAFPFHYNRIDELTAIVSRQGRNLAAIVMEPRRGQAPQPGFLEAVRALADETGAVLVFDEITSGFRMADGGIHLLHGVNPDLAVFAKAMANGYAMAAAIGRASVMQAAQSTFMSSTSWTERIGPAASLATIHKFRCLDTAAHLARMGDLVMTGWRSAAGKAGLSINVDGFPSLASFGFDHPDAPALSTLFTDAMLDRGFLAFTQFKPSLAHSTVHVQAYLEAVNQVFALVADAAAAGDAASRLSGPVARRGFYRLT
jgi:glutamate-1-semialdehyde 2,1-aminomutase